MSSIPLIYSQVPYHQGVYPESKLANRAGLEPAHNALKVRSLCPILHTGSLSGNIVIGGVC